jgi:hypothetical protein
MVSMGRRNTKPEVYLQESQKLNAFTSVESNGTLPWLGLIESSRTVRFSREKHCRINRLDGVASTG